MVRVHELCWLPAERSGFRGAAEAEVDPSGGAPDSALPSNRSRHSWIALPWFMC